MKKIITLLCIALLSPAVMANGVDSLLMEPHSDEPQAVMVPDSLWDRANTAYINEDFDGAMQIYNSIVERGLLSEKLYFNMGNTYYKQGDVARAILYYQKAKKLSPADDDILYNLRVAEAHTKDRIEQVPEFFLKSWSRSIESLFGCTGWTILSLVSIAILFASILLFLLSSNIRLRKSGFGVGILALLLAITSTIYASSQRQYMIEHSSAVVMSRTLSVKSSPDRAATDLFVLHEGTTVDIVERLGDWCNITIADGKKGWVEAKRIEVI